MKRLLLFVLLCFVAVVSAGAQNDSILVRKGTDIAFLDGSELTNRQLMALLDSTDFALYKKGHKKMHCSTIWFIVSSLSYSYVAYFSDSRLGINICKSIRPDSYQDWCDRGDLSVDFSSTKHMLLFASVPFVLAVSSTIIACRMNIKGSEMIDEACGSWNSSNQGKKEKPTLSFAAGPTTFGVTLSF